MTTQPSRPHHYLGLDDKQVEVNRARFGANLLTPPERDPWWRLYLEKFRDPIIRILVVAAVVALLVGLHDGEFVEGIGILVAILLSTGLSFLNEYRAAREFDILNQVSDNEECTVIRNNRHELVQKRDLVVGDIVLVSEGAEIPADGRVLEAVSFSLNESSLTGESAPVEKRPGDDAENAGLAYPRNIVLRGTTVADGHAVIELTAVGDASEIGKTARAAAETPDSMTPLARQLEHLATVISIGAFLAAAVIFLAQTIRGAVNGEIYDFGERAGRIVRLPLTGGQWYSFAVLVVVIILLTVRIWLPVLRNGLQLVGREIILPEWLDGGGARGLARQAGVALAVVVVAGLFGMATGIFSLGQDLPPLTALGAFLRYFMLAVTVIVVAVPEGLPMCVTLALAYSMRKMTASNNLVRKMHACETIGAASVICSDKTGTLTMNEMRVHQPVFPCVVDGVLPTSGGDADRLAEAASVNATANLLLRDGRMEPLGNPTESAILLWLHASGRDYTALRERFPVGGQLAFSTERKFMATAGRSAVDGEPVLYAKGAAEILLARCREYRLESGASAPLTDSERQAILDNAASYQNRGMRVLGFASRQVVESFLLETLTADSVTDLIWEGFFAIADPIRPEVPAALERALGAGIQVKVVTGDNQATAREIARQAGLWKDSDTDEQIIRGDEFEALSDADAAVAAGRIKFMSRARPLHKLRLVKLLQDQGEVVAVTGDGTNDAPALNHADVGLAMGKTGTAVAKEAADIILLDDSFNSIVNAVAWGRSLYANIQKFVVFQLTINLAAVGIALLGPFLGVTLPLTVIQMLWINLIMDTFAALALASEPPDWDLMNATPRRPDAFIISGPMKRCILGVGLAFLGLFVVTLLFQRWFPLDPAVPGGRHNLTLFFTAFVFLQFWNLWNARVFGSDRSAFTNLRDSKGFVAMALVILVGQVLLVEFGGTMFRVTPLSVAEWLALFFLTSPVLLIGEGWRLHRRSMQDPDYWRYS